MSVTSGHDILITGTTGFLGAELVPRLLAARPEAHIVCLMRAKSERHLAERRRALLTYAEIPAEQHSRIVAVAGDLRSEGLGLGDAALGLAERTSEIFHTAASTRFDLKLADARRINVDGARRVVEFARLAKARGGLRGLHHVSTAFTDGDPSGTPESPVFRNSYEQSKWEVERDLGDVSDELAIHIYRPSIIVGDAHTGKTRHFRVLYEPVKWVYTGLTDTIPCRPDTRLDVVPVNFVADAIVALSGLDTGAKRHTLAAGEAAAIRVEQFVEIAVAAGNAYHREIGGPPITAPTIVSPEVARASSGADRERFEKLYEVASVVMRSHLPYMLKEQLFEDPETTQRLAALGISCPPLSDYLDAIVRYALVHEFGNAARRRVPR